MNQTPRALSEVKLCNEHIQHLPAGGWPEYGLVVKDYTRIMPVGREQCMRCAVTSEGAPPKRYRAKGRDVPVVTRQQERALERREVRGQLFLEVIVRVFDSTQVVHREVCRVFERDRDVTVEKFDEIERVLTGFISKGNRHE